MSTPLDLEELRRVAEAARDAAESGGEWVVAQDSGEVGVTRPASGGVWVAVTGVAGYPAPTARAEHIATFDPPTVLALLDRLQAKGEGNV